MSEDTEAEDQEHATGGQHVLVVNSTEWRNLCARGSIRMGLDRPTTIRPGSPADDLRHAFTAAPATKIDSAVDVLVLTLRPNWREDAERHPSNGAVALLMTSDVLSHHVVADDLLEYYRSEASKAGVEIAGSAYRDAWRDWVLSEQARDATIGARRLATVAGVDWIWGPPAEADRSSVDLCRRVLGDAAAPVPPGIDLLLRRALTIDDAAASTRGTEAYHIVAALDWAEHATGLDLWDSTAVGPQLKLAVKEGKARPGDVPRRFEPGTFAALDLLWAAAPSAFDDDLPPTMIGTVCRLLAAAKIGSHDPGLAIEGLRSHGRNPGAVRVLALIAASLLGPEAIQQAILRSNTRPGSIHLPSAPPL